MLLLGGILCTPLQAAQPDEKTPRATYSEVHYGEYDRNVLDFWQAESETPTPVVIFIHGGGFVGGDKSSIRRNKSLQKYLDAGISFAAINYRFLDRDPTGRDDPQRAPIQTILRDAGRAVQFLRHKAPPWNIDPQRIAAFGSSAGAGTSLWLAAHDDLADPQSDDPVARQSSRLSAAGCLNGQFSYDLTKWNDVFGVSPEQFGRKPHDFYGLDESAQIDSPEVKAILADVDMRGLLSEGDPPLFLFCGNPDKEPTTRGILVHHPKHVLILKERCDALKIPCEPFLTYGPHQGQGSSQDALFAFMLKHLKQPTQAP
jgi:acetyl esterase/lipase